MHFFKDDKGNIVIAQKPNAPIIVWAISLGISILPVPEIVMRVAELIAFGALFTWGWLEITSGVNYFRRVLGLIVLIVLLYFRL